MSSTASPEKQLVGDRPGRRVRTKTVTRLLFLAHRYLGIAVGLLMVLWCVSGIVMMYVPYPELGAREYRAGLDSLPADDCCRLPDGNRPELAGPVDGFRIEGMAGTPVLRLQKPFGQEALINLRDGTIIREISPEQAPEIAAAFADHTDIAGAPGDVTRVVEDQWTVAGGFAPHRPLYKVRFDDAAGTVLYVSSRTGAVVQDTTARERFWNWLGAVPHWLYFTELRKHPETWTQVIIWTSVLGVFLTITGLYVGIRQYRRGADRRTSPYRGMAYWHHIAGLIFGILALTWVLSGLFSMTPWGLFQGDGAGTERARLEGPAMDWQTIRATVHRLGTHDLEQPVVQLQSAPLDGRLYLIAHGPDGARTRLDSTFSPAPLAQSGLAAAGRRLRPDSPIQSMELLKTEDAYYYGHPDPARLPVFRVIFEEPAATRYYLDPVSGAILSKVDAPRRQHRWWFYGLHRLDFAAWLRARPVWDLVTLPLLLGATVICATGVYMGARWLMGRRRRRGASRAV